jgi:hypothetical protein
MSLLANLATDAAIAEDRDTIGGNGPLASGLYPATIALAYLTKSAGGAIGLVLHAKTEAAGEIRQTLWMTSGTAKGAKNYYEKDGAKHYLPGFTLANSLALLAAGKEIAQLDTETKVVKVYSSEAQAEVPTKVEVPVDLLDKEILIGLIKQTVDKNVKDDDGKYVPTGETREENEIDKFFRARDKMTVAEIRAQAEEATFVNLWDQKWTGKERNKAKGAAAGGTAGLPKAAGAGAGAGAGTNAKKPTTSLFA